jgi:hypothetical protein
MKATLELYVAAVTYAAQLSAEYVACTDDDAAPALWAKYESALDIVKRQRVALARVIAASAGVDAARVIL